MLAINQTITPSHEGSDIEQVLNTNLRGESAIEEIPRPDLQLKQHVWNPPPMFINTTPWKRYAAFISLATFDMAMNAAAGCAAATIGAKINHKLLTPQVLQLGALAGVTKAGITSFRELVLMSPINFMFRTLLLLMFSSFGICLVLTAEVCNIVLEETPKELLIAAVVAAIPLIFESVRDLEPKPDQEGHTYYMSRPILSIFLLASNPLGGYVFARMAANQGMPISNYPAACSAGAVYAIITFLSRTITACITCVQTTRNGTTRNVFGRYEWYQPEPVMLTEEEHRILNQMLSKTTERAFGRVTRLAKTSEGVRGWALRVLARLACCVCCVERKVRREAREKLREKAGRQRDVTVWMEEWAMEMRGSAVRKFPALEA